MSTLRIYAWGDATTPAGYMAAIGEPRQWLAVAAPGWAVNTDWIDRIEATLDDGTRLVAGNDPPRKVPKPKPPLPPRQESDA